MAKLQIENHQARLLGITDMRVLKDLDTELSYRVQGHQFMNVPGWDGRYRLFKKSGYFPIGLLPRVEKILNDYHIDYTKIDNRSTIKYGPPLRPDEDSHFEDRDYQTEAIQTAVREGSGIVRMATGCHLAGQGILMFDGSIKKVENIKVGDKIMGPDSKPRNVLKLCKGRSRMIKIIPNKGNPFVINDEHILSLKRTRKKINDSKAGEIIDISFKEWEKKSKTFKHLHKLFRVGVNFKYTKFNIDPYFMGLYLGDGSTAGEQVIITTNDNEIIDYIKNYCFKNDLDINKRKLGYYLSSKEKTKNKNFLLNELKKLNLFKRKSGEKFIPISYKTASREQRLQLLAGLIDSDGSLIKNNFDFISRSYTLAEDVAFLCRSLGLAAYISECNKKCYNNGKIGKYYRVSISGNCNIIPTKILRKKANKRNQKKDVLVTGFKYEEFGFEDYYGFQVDSDNRYLLDDFTVTHNSGKSYVISRITGEMNVNTVIYVIGIELLHQMKNTLEEIFPGTKIGMVGDGICDVQKITVATVWSAAAAYNKKAIVFDSDLTPDSKKKAKLINKQKVRDMVSAAEMIVIDECQYAAAETIQFLHKESVNARHRLLFSGTPWRESGDDLLIEAVGGQKIIDIDASFLIERGYLVQPEIHFLNVPRMRGVGDNYPEVYKNYIEKNNTRNMLIMEATKHLVQQGRKVLILVTKVNHGKKLLEDLQFDLRVASLDGRSSTSERLHNIKRMKDDELDVLIASKIFDQGVDIPNLDAVVLAGSGKSGARALQRIGRVIRPAPGKEKAIVVDFKDNCKYLKEHSKARYRIYKTEKLFKVRVES